jgi:replicative DNA helicase
MASVVTAAADVVVADYAPAAAGQCDVDAERAVISAVLLDPSVFADLTLTPDDFFDRRHADLWRRITAADDAGRPIDHLTLTADDFFDRRHTDIWRGEAATAPTTIRAYLVDLIGVAPSAASAGHYARLIIDRAVLRRLAQAGTRIVQATATADAGNGVADIAETCRGLVDNALATHHHTDASTFIDDDVRVELHQPTEASHLSTPWPELDRLTGGLHRGDLVVLGARPGVGKSMLGQQLAWHVAKHGHPVLISSLEMSTTEVHCRLIAAATGLPLGRITDHRLTDDEWATIDRVTSTLDAPIVIDDRASVRVVDIRGRARDVARRHGPLGLIVVDYLQLVTPASHLEARERQVGGITRSLKLLAKEMRTPVLAMSQVNRAPTGRTDKRPTLADLRESGAIESDADVVILLHRDDADDDLETNAAKNRHGYTGASRLLWQPEHGGAVPIYRPDLPIHNGRKGTP